jgi:hypothetical protein
VLNVVPSWKQISGRSYYHPTVVREASLASIAVCTP